MKKKFYLIALINLRFEILMMLNIKVMVKLGDIIYQMKLKDRSRNKKKAKPEDIT